MPEIVTDVLLATVFVVTVKFVLEDPAATVTLGGTLAADVLLLDRVTTAPPEGAAPDSVTVPCDVPPPMTLVGLSVSNDNVTGGGGLTVSDALLVAPP